jgi:hypothetical protein
MQPIDQINPLTNPTPQNTCGEGIDINTTVISSSHTSNSHPTTDSIVLPLPFLSPSSTSTFDNNTLSSYTSHSTKPLLPLPLLFNTFLSSDLTQTSPKLGKWKRYKNGRIICSEDCHYLIVKDKRSGNEGKGSGNKEKWDIFRLPKNDQEELPVHCNTFTSSKILNFKKMLDCKNVTGKGFYFCQHCPRCLNYKSDGKIFVRKSSAIRREEEFINDLKEWERDNRYLSNLQNEHDYLEKSGYIRDAGVLRNRIKRLEEGMADSKWQIFYAEQYLERLYKKKKMVKGSAKLSNEPHFYISICTPRPLDVLYNAVDDWFEREVPKPSTRTSTPIQGILKGLEGKEAGFSDMLRFAFSKLVKEAVEETCSVKAMTYICQLHPFNKYGPSPDMHFLIRGRSLEGGSIRPLSFNQKDLLDAVEVKMHIFLEFVNLLIRELNKIKNRTFRSSNTSWSEETFRDWRKSVKEAEKTFKTKGIPTQAVDIQIRKEEDLLGTQAYLRKYPYEYIKEMSFDKRRGKVCIWYWSRKGTERKPVVVGLIDFLFRLTGFDNRRYGVLRKGDYRSTKGNNMYKKLRAYDDASEKSITDTTEAMR